MGSSIVTLQGDHETWLGGIGQVKFCLGERKQLQELLVTWPRKSTSLTA